MVLVDIVGELMVPSSDGVSEFFRTCSNKPGDKGALLFCGRVKDGPGTVGDWPNSSSGMGSNFLSAPVLSSTSSCEEVGLPFLLKGVSFSGDGPLDPLEFEASG